MRDNLTEIHLTDGSNPEVLVEAVTVDADGNMLTRTNQQTNEVISYGWSDFDLQLHIHGLTVLADLHDANQR